MPPREKKDTGFFTLSSGSRRFMRYGHGDLLRDGRRYMGVGMPSSVASEPGDSLAFAAAIRLLPEQESGASLCREVVVIHSS